MDTPTLVESDVRRRIFADQALSKPKIKRGPGAEANRTLLGECTLNLLTFELSVLPLMLAPVSRLLRGRSRKGEGGGGLKKPHPGFVAKFKAKGHNVKTVW